METHGQIVTELHYSVYQSAVAVQCPMGTTPMYCQYCGALRGVGSRFCQTCGMALELAEGNAAAPPPVEPPPNLPPPPPGYVQGYPYYQQPPPAQDNPLSSVFPSKNGQALAAYYLGCFSVPIGILAIPAIIFGILGYRAYRARPEIKGAAHAWIGIVVGSLVLLAWIVALVVMFAHPY